MSQRPIRNVHLNQNNNDVMRNRHNRCNGDVKLTDFKLQKFPWRVFCGLWTVCTILAVGIPYFAKNIPPAHRTDIKWWMSGVVYQVPPPQHGYRQYFSDIAGQLDHLASLGVTAIRISEFFQQSPDGSVRDYLAPNPIYGNMEDFQNLMDTVVKKDMRLIVDVPLVYTSIEHAWFQQETRHQSRDTVYVWQNTPQDNVQDTGMSHWEQEVSRNEYYQYIDDNHHHVSINYANNLARRKIQSVFSYWLHRGVSGFILQDYDRLVFHYTPSHSFNHIQFEDARDTLLRHLANLTQTFKQHLVDFELHELEDPDEPLDVLLAVELSQHDDAAWDTLYDAGIDMIVNQELSLGRDQLLHGDTDPFRLRQQVRATLKRLGVEYTAGWRVCSGSTLTSTEGNNTRNLINMVQLLLPGTAFLCQAQLPPQGEQQGVSNVSADHLRQLSTWRRTAAMTWGETQLSYVNAQTFSFVRYAFGKMYPRYIVIVNFGDQPQRNNFTMVREGLTVPSLGTLHYYSCPEGGQDSEPHVINTLVHLNHTLVHPRCGLLVELKIKPPL